MRKIFLGKIGVYSGASSGFQRTSLDGYKQTEFYLQRGRVLDFSSMNLLPYL